jgi:hypothetical protein
MNYVNSCFLSGNSAFDITVVCFPQILIVTGRRLAFLVLEYRKLFDFYFIRNIFEKESLKNQQRMIKQA